MSLEIFQMKYYDTATVGKYKEVIMTTAKKSWFKYLMPGLVFQQVVIGGGYGTGAEIAQFFGTQGLVGGLMGQAVTMVMWAIICAVSFEFVRIFRTFDYGSFMNRLLGKGYILYEICYWIMMILVIGIVNASAGSIIATTTGLSRWVGIAILSVGMIYLVLKGAALIEKALSMWSYVMYAVYIIFMAAIFIKFGDNISAEFAKAQVEDTWLFSGMQYTFYNLVCIPVVLYTVREMETRKEAIACGLFSGFFGIIPAVLLLLVMGCDFSAAVSAEIPVSVVFDRLDMTWLYIAFEIVLMGTLIATGTGFIKAVDDRIEIAYRRKHGNVAAWIRPVITIGLTILSIVVSTFGLIPLIAKGYGTICWGFFILFAVPILTIGIYKIKKHGPIPDPDVEEYNSH